jgi:predicted porin
MKKTLLAAALFAGFAGFAGVAQAETQVTLYGILDEGLEVTNIKTANGTSFTTTGLTPAAMSGNRWGMKGTEDLGGGTQVTFVLESGFNMNDGKSAQGGRLFGRRAFLGLQNASWGSVRVGRGPTIATDMFSASNSDPFGYGFGALNLGSIATSLNTYRTDNQLSYMSPVFAGFQVGAGYSFNIADSTTDMAGSMHDNTKAFNVAGTYTNGPLFLGLSYDQTNVPNTSTAQKGSIRQLVLNGSYDFQVVRIYGAYVRGWNGLAGSGPAADLSASVSLGLTAPDFAAGDSYANGMKQNAFMIGVSAPIGTATSVFATYQHQTLGGSSGYGVTSATNTFGAGVSYNLSKRTNVYGAIGYTNGVFNTSGLKATSGIVGLRHQF